MKEKLRFDQTCRACPEQYDVFLGDKQVGYLRLRGGSFSVDYPDCGGETLFSHKFDDGWKGCFEGDEREKYLKIAAKVIKEKIKSLTP